MNDTIKDQSIDLLLPLTDIIEKYLTEEQKQKLVILKTKKD